MSSNENILVLLYDMCRLCLERVGRYNLFSHDYTEIIAECAGVQVTLGDELPQSICEVCVERLNVCKELRTLAKQCDVRLRLLRDSARRPTTESDTECEIILPEILMTSPEDSMTINEPSSHTYIEREQTVEETSPHVPRIRVRVDIFDGQQDKGSTSTKDLAKTNQIEGKSTQQIAEGSTNIVSQFFTGSEALLTKSKRCRIDSEDVPIAKMKQMAESNAEWKQPKTEDLTCEMCGKMCANSKALYLHRRGHIKNHVCPVCNKAFSTKNDLVKHLRVHTGEKPFQCHICQKSFTQAGTLKNHVETHEKSSHLANETYKFAPNQITNTYQCKKEIKKIQTSKYNDADFNISEISTANVNSQIAHNSPDLQEFTNDDVNQLNIVSVKFYEEEDDNFDIRDQDQFDGPIKVKIGATPRLRKKNRSKKVKEVTKDNVNSNVGESNSNHVDDINVNLCTVLINEGSNIDMDATETVAENENRTRSDNLIKERDVNGLETSELGELMQDTSKVLENTTENDTDPLRSNEDGEKDDGTENIEQRTDTNECLSNEPTNSGNCGSDKVNNSYTETMNVATMDDANPKTQKRDCEKEDEMNFFEESFNGHESSSADTGAITSGEDSKRDTSTVNREKRAKMTRVHTCKSCKQTFDRNVELLEHRKRHRRILRFC